MIRIQRPGPPGPNRGIALISVLWVCALVSILAAGFSYVLRNEAQLNSAILERARAAAGADAAMQRVMAMLTTQAGSRRGTPLQHYTLHFDGMEIEIELASEAGKIDLNAAPAVLIENLLQRAAGAVEGLDSHQAKALAEAILDWRDADSRTRGQGAERREYLAQELAGPRDQPFIRVAELRQVIGINQDVFDFLAPLVSVDSQISRIDPRAAARDTLLALPGLDEAQVDRYLASRSEGEGASVVRDLLKRSKNLQVPGRIRTYSISALARTRSGVQALRRAVIQFNRNSAMPIAILDWSRYRLGNALVGANDSQENI